ncbi:MAG: DUF2283 domain-containing protein [Gammaproteobacteria bacterium]
MRVDQEADALYLRLDESKIIESEEVSPGVRFSAQQLKGPTARHASLAKRTTIPAPSRSLPRVRPLTRKRTGHVEMPLPCF